MWSGKFSYSCIKWTSSLTVTKFPDESSCKDKISKGIEMTPECSRGRLFILRAELLVIVIAANRGVGFKGSSFSASAISL